MGITVIDYSAGQISPEQAATAIGFDALDMLPGLGIGIVGKAQPGVMDMLRAAVAEFLLERDIMNAIGIPGF